MRASPRVSCTPWPKAFSSPSPCGQPCPAAGSPTGCLVVGGRAAGSFREGARTLLTLWQASFSFPLISQVTCLLEVRARPYLGHAQQHLPLLCLLFLDKVHPLINRPVLRVCYVSGHHFRHLQRTSTAAVCSLRHLRNCDGMWGKDHAVPGVMALDTHLPGHPVGSAHRLWLTAPAPSLTSLSSCCQRCESCRVGRPPHLGKGWQG